MALRQKLHREAPSPQSARDLSISWEKLGDVAQALGRLEEAERGYRESLALRQKLHREAPSPQSARDLSISWSKLGDVAQALGRLEEAERAYREGLTLSEKLHREAPSPQSARDLSISWERLGDVARKRGELEEARTGYDESIALVRGAQRAYGETLELLDDLAISLLKAAGTRAEEGRGAEAAELLSEAERHAKRLAIVAPQRRSYAGLLEKIAALRKRLEQPFADTAAKT